MNKFSYQLLVILAFLALYLIWGTTYLVIAIGLKGFPPFIMAGLRFLAAGILLVGYSLWKREGIPPRSSLIKNAFLALVVLAGGQGLLMWSEQFIASGYASILIATLPIWFVIMDRSNWNFYFSNPFIIIGVVLGFVGIVVLFKDKLDEPLSSEDIYLQITASMMVLLGGICWVVGTLYNRSKPAPGSIHANLGWQLLFGALICFVISLLLSEPSSFDWSRTDATAWSAVAYLAIAGSIIAFIAYTWLLNEKPSALVGTYAYINPVVAVFLGWLIADEIITWLQIIGMAIILISAILINLNRTKSKVKA